MSLQSAPSSELLRVIDEDPVTTEYWAVTWKEYWSLEFWRWRPPLEGVQ